MLSLKLEVITEIKMERFEASAVLYQKFNTCVEKLLSELLFSEVPSDRARALWTN